jgi:hypothetical protein
MSQVKDSASEVSPVSRRRMMWPLALPVVVVAVTVGLVAAARGSA